MKVTKMKDGDYQVFWKIKSSTWESIMRVSMKMHITPEQLIIKAIEKVT